MTCLDCPQMAYARGYCRKHYDKHRRGNHPPIRGNRRIQKGSWLEPADWVVVERVAAGEHMNTNPAERRQLVALLTSRGRSAADIARRLGIAQGTVVRIRRELRAGIFDPDMFPENVALKAYRRRTPETYEP